MPTPRGFQYVEGIYLYPSLNLLKPYCRTAAQSTGFGVPCPAFTPGVPAGFVGCVNIQRCYSTGEFVLEGKSFGPLSSYRGASTESCAPPPRRTCTTVHNVIHLLFVAASPEKLSEVECCGARATNDRVTVRGRPARWLTFPPGSDLNSGHVLLEWHVAGVTYGVSLHADNKTNRHLAQLLAKYVQLVK
jgi:hypothetical protein